jgi:hypothetical protein
MMPDSQTVEIIGRNLLVSWLVSDGLEVARPERDRGIDLIAYRDDQMFTAVPIQMKAATSESFSVNRKYDKFGPSLLLVHVWNMGTPDQVAYCLTYAEGMAVAEEMGYTNTATWQQRGEYSTTSPSAKLRALLQPHRMEAGDWLAKVAQLTG